MARELRVTCGNTDTNQHLCSPDIELSSQSTLSAAFTHRAASQSLILLLQHKPQQYFYRILLLKKLKDEKVTKYLRQIMKVYSL